MFCKYCGKEIEDSSITCEFCGKETVQSEAPQPETKDTLMDTLLLIKKQKEEKKAKSALILGIASLFAWFLPIFGYPVAIIGLIMGVAGLKTEKKSSAVVGIVLCVVGLIATIINSALGVMQQLG